MVLDYSDIVETDGYKALRVRAELRTNFTIFSDNSLDLLEEMKGIEGNVLTQEQLESFSKDALDPEGEGMKAAFDMIHRPIIRKLNNYLSSCFAFRDYLYNLDSLVTEQKTASEIKARASSVFQDSKERAFLQDLRNIYTHMGGLFPSFTIQYHVENDGKITHQMYYCFKKRKMLEQSKWSRNSREYFDSWPDEMKLLDIVNEYSKQVQENYQWTIDYYSRLYEHEMRDAYRNIAELNELVTPSH